jgi:hypothetical protein
MVLSRTLRGWERSILMVAVVLMCTTPARELKADPIEMDFSQQLSGNGSPSGCGGLFGNSLQVGPWLVRRRLASGPPTSQLDIPARCSGIPRDVNSGDPVTIGAPSLEGILPPISKRFYLASGGVPSICTPPVGGSPPIDPPPVGSAPVPLPASLWSGLILAAVLGIGGTMRRKTLGSRA